MKTAIYGAGSLGTVLGAYLAKAGVDVDLITRNREHVDALNKDGAKIIGTVNMTVPVHALTPDEMTEKYELIILLTKQLDNVNVLKNLQKNMTDDCIVCTLQNGLPELSVSEVVGEDRTMGCTVAWGATLHGKGVSELTSEPDSRSYGLGRLRRCLRRCAPLRLRITSWASAGRSCSSTPRSAACPPLSAAPSATLRRTRPPVSAVRIL